MSCWTLTSPQPFSSRRKSSAVRFSRAETGITSRTPLRKACEDSTKTKNKRKTGCGQHNWSAFIVCLEIRTRTICYHVHSSLARSLALSLSVSPSLSPSLSLSLSVCLSLSLSVSLSVSLCLSVYLSVSVCLSLSLSPLSLSLSSLQSKYWSYCKYDCSMASWRCFRGSCS